MVRNHAIDTKFAFLAHLVQKLEAKPIFWVLTLYTISSLKCDLSRIIPVPKAGDLSKPDNYQGISLTCITAKVYNRMIINRIRQAIDLHLRENQNGFREGRTTTAQILAQEND